MDMIDFLEINEGSIKLIHHSTASVIEIRINELSSIWMDYYEIADLVRALEKAELAQQIIQH